MVELEKIGINDIEKLIRLADDVLRQMEVNAYLYNDEGVAFYEKVDEQEPNYYELVDSMMQEPIHKEKCDKFSRLMYQIMREEKSFGEVYFEPITYLKDQMEPYKKRIIGLFRNGTMQDTVTNETSYVVDESVTDDYLMELFVMRIRDRRIIMAVQRFQNTYYLLLRDYPCVEEADKYVGIYDDIRKLRQAYEAECEKLVSEKDKYPFVLSLQIYKFEEEADGKQVSQGRLIKIIVQNTGRSRPCGFPA